MAKSTTSRRPDDASRWRQRCPVRTDIVGALVASAFSGIITARSTARHACHRCRAKNRGKIRHVAPHVRNAHRNTNTVTTTGSKASPSG